MALSIAKELAAHPELVFRITVDEYHAMLKRGSIEEGAPFELLDGQIVRKIRNARGKGIMTIGTRHATGVLKLGNLNPRLMKLGCHMRLQSPTTLPPNDEPEPDGLIVRGSINRYRSRHPGPTDALCVFEVSDASLRLDRGYKQQLYASCGIPMYVIVNLVDDTLEVRTKPIKDRYSDTIILERNQRLRVPTARTTMIMVPVLQLLP